MKLKILMGCFFLIFINYICCDINIYMQAPLEFCSYPDIREGIIDIIYIDIENLWHQGKYDRIFPLFKLLTSISPEDEEGWVLGGWFLINAIAPMTEKKNKREEIEKMGIEFLKEGMERIPKSYNIPFEIAWFYYTRGKYEESFKYINYAEKNGQEYKIKNLKAYVLEKLGKREEAILVWEEIKEKFPEFKDVAERNIKKLKKLQ